MYRINNITTIFMAIVIILSILTLGDFSKKAQASEVTNPSMTLPAQSPENMGAKTSEGNLSKARESFLQNNYKAAAEDIRKTVAYMKTQEAKASSSGKRMLTASINELDKLADNVEKGSVTSVNTLDNAFSRAKDAITSNSQMRTAESKTSQASSGVKNGLSWTGDKLKSGFVAVAKGTGWIVGKAVEGTGWVSKKTGSAINSAGLKVEHFGKNMQPQKQQTLAE